MLTNEEIEVAIGSGPCRNCRSGGEVMADITMCNDKECPKNHQCYRFTAPANPYRQSYFVYSPREDDKCKEFVPAIDEGHPV